MAKQTTHSLIDILKIILTGGKSNLNKIFKDDPDLAKNSADLKGAYIKIKKRLDDLDEKYKDL